MKTCIGIALAVLALAAPASAGLLVAPTRLVMAYVESPQVVADKLGLRPAESAAKTGFAATRFAVT